MSIRSLLEANLRRNPSRCAFTFRRGKKIACRTYAEVGERVRRISEVAVSVGLEPRSAPAAIILENCPQWIELYLGHCSIAVPVVPVDPKLRPEEISYMMNDAGVAVIYTDSRHVPVLQEIASSLPALRHIVLVDGVDSHAASEVSSIPVHDLETEMARLAASAESPSSAYSRFSVSDDDIASIIYTSGTTGRPKGALITHGNFCADIAGAHELIPSHCSADDFFIILPLFHAFSFTANFMAAIYVGAGMQFATSLRTIGEDMKAFKPTIVMAVPLLVEKMHDKIASEIRKSRLARVLLTLWLEGVVNRSIIRSLGGRLRLMIVGGAPCSADLIVAMRRIGIPIIEGYGLTETSPIVSISRMERFKPGTIGFPLPNIEVRIADRNEHGVGELQVRGPIVMKGYLNKPEATAETIDADGWLHTGDLASQDEDGFITIRGRKKALIVNREGKNIYPEEVETCIGGSPKILDVVVVGYSDTQGEVGEKVGAIVVPNLEAFGYKVKKQKRISETEWRAIEEETRKIVIAQCHHLAEYKHPRKIAVYREPLERTSSQKIRRYVYQNDLNG
ncbi:MAG: AMP-binding protein [Kiritimatiellae bacterium]|nr:AMP-binding protein [Kiritimatiellia bacterium]